MKKINYKGRCEKRKVSKCKDICRTYSKIQSALVNALEKDEDVVSFECNVCLEGVSDNMYSSDFVINGHDIILIIDDYLDTHVSRVQSKPQKGDFRDWYLEWKKVAGILRIVCCFLFYRPAFVFHQRLFASQRQADDKRHLLVYTILGLVDVPFNKKGDLLCRSRLKSRRSTRLRKWSFIRIE